MNRTGSATATP